MTPGAGWNANALLDIGQMGRADRAAVEAGTPVATLMRNAGAAVAREIRRRYAPSRVVALCGPGNNGGDGIVAARELAGAGWPVRVALLGGDPAVFRGAAREQAQAWQGGFEAVTPAVLGDAELVIDALFGAGFRGMLDGEARTTLAAVSASGLRVVAVDVPSGVSGDSGAASGAATASVTVTFFRRKPGHLLLPGRALCGETVVADIGIADGVLDGLGVTTFANDPALWLDSWPRPALDDHKYRRGHALVIGGYPLTGAARLAARAAARAGAGLTTIAAPEPAWPVYGAGLLSIMLRPLGDAADLAALMVDHRVSASLIGPGAGSGAETRQRVRVLLDSGKPAVLDADALTAFRDDAAALFASIRGPCVMTPHDGEFARLFDVGGDRLSRARAAARRSGAVVLLKGADTVVAAPDGRAIINSNAPPTLATAGAGDVLAGIITGLLAQGMDAWLAAAAGAWLHGAAAGEFGPGLVADDLPEMLPAVLRSLRR